MISEVIARYKRMSLKQSFFRRDSETKFDKSNLPKYVKYSSIKNHYRTKSNYWKYEILYIDSSSNIFDYNKLDNKSRLNLRMDKRNKKLNKSNKENDNKHILRHRSMQVFIPRSLNPREFTNEDKINSVVDCKNKSTTKLLVEEHWKTRHEKLLIKHSRLSFNYESLARNFKKSEEIRNKQSEQIKLLQREIVDMKKSSEKEILPIIRINVKKKEKCDKEENDYCYNFV